MGACAGGVKKPSVQILKEAKSLLQKEQRYVLELIFEDLACRITDHKVNLENFRLFFQKNGLWGEKLFKQFDYDESNYISLQEFMRGIARIFKTSQSEKISLLFSFFAQNQGNKNQGIPFSQFLGMLYNYPKEDLKGILNDEDFFNQQLKRHLVSMQENRRLDSVYRGSKGFVVCKIDESQSSERFPSTFGKNILKNLNNSIKDKGTSLEFKYGQSKVEVRTANIHQLVKKFARNVFKSYDIDIQKGKLNAWQFQEWITNHKNFYTNYYKGFHNEIWEFDTEGQKYKFAERVPQKESMARFKVGQKLKKVKLVHFQAILVVLDSDNGDKPISIICLEGLAVKKKLFKQETGFGIEIIHRDGVYPPKQLFFKNEDICKEWLQELKCYKGESVEALYEFKEKIGTGKFSVVYKAIERETKRKYAIKVIQTYKLDHQARELIAHESSIMSVLTNPFLVGYKNTIQTKTKIFIITELIEGKDLFEYIKQNRNLTEREAAMISYQMIAGTKYLHSLGIVHRDLKPENIMINLEEGQATGMVKIIDFGFSNYLRSLRELAPQDVLAGTPNYIAPEMLKTQPIDEKIDNFAIGVIIFFMLSGNLPFNGMSIPEIFQKTMDGFFNFGNEWSTISIEAKTIVTGLLENDPVKRMSLEDALHHPWLRTAARGTTGQTNKIKKGTVKSIEVF